MTGELVSHPARLGTPHSGRLLLCRHPLTAAPARRPPPEHPTALLVTAPPGAVNTGVDVEPVSTFRDLVAKREFISRNFTAGECHLDATMDYGLWTHTMDSS